MIGDQVRFRLRLGWLLLYLLTLPPVAIPATAVVKEVFLKMGSISSNLMLLVYDCFEMRRKALPVAMTYVIGSM